MSFLPDTELRRPDALALSDADRTLTYLDLRSAVARMAGALAARGIVPGDRVATCLPTTIEHAIAIHGISWLGAVVVPLHPRLASEELEWQVRDAGARLVISAENLGELLAGGVEREPHTPTPGDLASILYTSGTTGRPKPVPLTWANHRASIAGSVDRLGTAPDDDWLCPLPLAHVGGLAVLHRAAALGTAATLTDGFDAERVAGLLASGRVTMASMVPTMLRRLVALGRPLPAPRLRAILLGGGPVDKDTLERALGLGLPLAPSYGMTETASQLTTVAPAEARRKGFTAGRPIVGAEVQIRDNAGRLLGATGGQPGEAVSDQTPGGQPGEAVPRQVQPGEAVPDQTSGTIWVRGPMVMAGYLGRTEENAARFDAEGWFSTGDLGRLDTEGYLTIETRREDLIVTGGENVYPAEVERVLLGHPAVADCAVLGLPDPEWGQRVAAVVVVHPGFPLLAPEELSSYVRARLAAFKIPRIWAFRDELPRTASGKLKRAQLREELQNAPGNPSPPG